MNNPQKSPCFSAPSAVKIKNNQTAEGACNSAFIIQNSSFPCLHPHMMVAKCLIKWISGECSTAPVIISDIYDEPIIIQCTPKDHQSSIKNHQSTNLAQASACAVELFPEPPLITKIKKRYRKATIHHNSIKFNYMTYNVIIKYNPQTHD